MSCRPDPFVRGFRIAPNATLWNIKEFIYDWGFIILLAISIILFIFLIKYSISIFLPKYKKKRKSFIIKAVVFFILLIISLFFWMLTSINLTGCDWGNEYLSNSEFIAKIGEPGTLYEGAIFEKGGRLDISESNYSFNCINQKCNEIIILEKDNKKIIAKEKYTRAILFTCKDINEINIYLPEERTAFEDFINPSKIIPIDCYNEKELLKQKDLGYNPAPEKFNNTDICKKINQTYERRNCFISIALRNKDVEICNEIEDYKDKESCISFVYCYWHDEVINPEKINKTEYIIFETLERCQNLTLAEHICYEKELGNLSPEDYGRAWIKEAYEPYIGQMEIKFDETNNITSLCRNEFRQIIKTDSNGRFVIEKNDDVEREYELFKIDGDDIVKAHLP